VTVRKTSGVDTYLANRISALRERQGLLLVDVAQAIGIPATELADYEAGRQRLSASNLYLLSRSLGVTMHEIFDGLLAIVPDDTVQEQVKSPINAN
jgi:transcriptional regulator with XRE-family HTH domain